MPDANNSGGRLQALIKTRNLSQRQFADALGFSQSFIARIERGAALPSRSFIEAVSQAFGISADWLLLGIGKMTGDPPVPRFGPPDHDRPAHGDVTIRGFEYSVIDRFLIDVSAGRGIVVDTEARGGGMAFPTSWLSRHGISADHAGLVRVTGDSMQPTIPAGALVLVHRSEMDVLREGIFAFRRGAEAFIKRLVPSNFDADRRPQTLTVISDNRSYPTLVVEGADLQDMRIAGRVRDVLIGL